MLTVWGFGKLISWQNNLSTYERKSVAATFSTQLEELERQSPHSSNLLKVLSFFDPESIPLEIIAEEVGDLVLECASDFSGTADDIAIRQGATSEAESLIALMRSPVQLQLAIQQLIDLSLTDYQDTKVASTLRIHDLIQVVVHTRIGRKDMQYLWFQVAVVLVCNALQRIDDPTSYKSWAKCEILNPHIQSLTKWDDKNTIGSHYLNEANFKIASYMTSRGRYRDAELLYVRVLVSNENTLGADHQNTLWTVANLAVVYQNQGRHKEAILMLERVLAGKEKLYGNDDPYNMTTIEHLANTCLQLGQYDMAERLYLRVLKVREDGLGVEHSATLQTVHNLAGTYNLQGRHSEAETLYGQALSGNAKAVGYDHHNTLSIKGDLAINYQLQGKCEKAEKLFREVLVKTTELQGAEHPLTLTTLYNLAGTCSLQERYGEAETMYKQLLISYEKVLGVGHLNMLYTVRHLVALFESRGAHDEAIALQKRFSMVSYSSKPGSETPGSNLEHDFFFKCYMY